ncbi:permease-like cell division protein FtsX [Luteimonas sp. MJ293]|uniref:permease-like cell division protein FtsX n=1 Tax=Luteimonas sp. MJ146 TaxID=3129240 RepID=UPI0031BBAD23
MSEQRAASTPAAPTAPRSGLGTWGDHHLYSFFSSLGRVFRRPWATALTIGVMAVALALPMGLWLVLDNVSRLSGSVQESREIGVFLQQDMDAAAAGELADRLRARADVASVELRTPEQGLQELRERGGLGDAIDAVGENPLPSLLIVIPEGDEMALAGALRALPEAALVQHDAEWRQRLDDWLEFGARLVLVLGVLLGLGALLVVGNTVRLDIQARREEIGVLQLLGATDGFIRRPFLYLGAWYGLGSGALALTLLAVTGMALRAPVAELAASYGSGFALRGFSPLQLLAVLVGSGALGWIGASVVTGHFLRQTRPTDT